MPRPTDREDVQRAWAAFAGTERSTGYMSISIDVGGATLARAGRRCPSGEEAILVGFARVRIPHQSAMPEGHGFSLTRAAGEDGDEHSWLALSRKSDGSLELFTLVVADIVRMLGAYPQAAGDQALALFLSRLRSWQDFMARDRDGVLGAEAELGLVGELAVLSMLLDKGVPARSVLEAWQGPLSGLHDFLIGTGALEVKSTLAMSGFPASIGSLDQLDETLRFPLFLTALRFSQEQTGETLPEMIESLRTRMEPELQTLDLFDSLVMRAGYFAPVADRYTRRFSSGTSMVLPVDDDFPRLVRGNVPNEIRRVAYDMDLEPLADRRIELGEALVRLGVA